MKSEKLMVLRALAPDVAARVEGLCAELSRGRGTPVPLRAVVSECLGRHGLPPSALAQRGRAGAAVVQARRDIALARYLLCCPFARRLGVPERMPAREANELARAIGVPRGKLFPTYISPARAHYRIYAAYRREMDGVIGKLEGEGGQG